MITEGEAIGIFIAIFVFIIGMGVLNSIGSCGNCECSKRKCKECGSDMERMSRNITRFSQEGDSPVKDVEIFYYCEKCDNKEIV